MARSFNDLELRHLVALDAVATEGTFGKAALRLGYTQSAVSQQIAALERIVGGAVFDRPGGPRPVELTPLGEVLLGHARDLLARVDVAAGELERFRTGSAGRLLVGTFQSVSTSLLPSIVGRMRTERPDVEIRLFESDLDDELDAKLGGGELDVSFVVGDLDDRYESVALLTDPFVLLAPHGEFEPGPVRVELLSGRPFIGQQETSSCQRLNELGLAALGCQPTYVFRTNDNGAVTAMVAAGMGLAVQPLLCTDPGDRRVAIHQLDPPIPDRVISVAWRRGRTLSPAAQHFVGLASEVATSIDRRHEDLSVRSAAPAKAAS
jgi:DNA-binding transcriptional LysR family regulator